MNTTERSDDTLRVIQHIDSMFEAAAGRAPAEIAAYGEQLKAAMKEHDSPRKTIDFEDVFGRIDELVAMYSAASAKPVTADSPAASESPSATAPQPVPPPDPTPAPPLPASPSPAPPPSQPVPAPRPAWKPEGSPPEQQQDAGDAGRPLRTGPAASSPRRRRGRPLLAIGVAVAVLVLVAAVGTYLLVTSNRPSVGETGTGQTAVAGDAIAVGESALFRARQTFIRDYADALARYLEVAGSYPSATDAFLDARTTFGEMATRDVAFPVPRAVLDDTIRYVSNGRSYKFILYGTGDCYLAGRLAPETVDPARSFGDVDCYAYGAWTPAFEDR